MYAKYGNQYQYQSFFLSLTTLVATMLKSRVRPDVGQLSVDLAVLRHIYVCSDVNMSLSRCWCFIIDGNDSKEGNVYGSCKLHLWRRCCSLMCDLTWAN